MAYMTIDPFDGRKVDKLFEEARKFYKDVARDVKQS